MNVQNESGTSSTSPIDGELLTFLTPQERAELDSLLTARMSFRELPTSVLRAILASHRRLVASDGVRRKMINLGPLDLDADLKQFIAESYRVGYWIGPLDPPLPWERPA